MIASTGVAQRIAKMKIRSAEGLYTPVENARTSHLDEKKKSNLNEIGTNQIATHVRNGGYPL